MSKTLKSIAPVAAKSMAAGIKTYGDALIGVMDAETTVKSARTGLALFLNKTYGVMWCASPKSKEAEGFVAAWSDDNAKRVEAAATPERGETIKNSKGVNLGRLQRLGCELHIAAGTALTPEQQVRADKLIKTYPDNKPKAAKGTISPRGFKGRVKEETIALYKYAMNETDFEGMSDLKVSAITGAFEQVLRALGVDPASVLEKKNAK